MRIKFCFEFHLDDMNITKSCIDYLQVHHDAGILLATINSTLDNNNGPEDAAMILLQPEHQSILQDNGWDLLTMFSRYLQSSSSSLYTLICKIIDVSSPKEMCLALMEQLETSQDMKRSVLLLGPLQNAVSRVSNAKIEISVLTNLLSVIMKYSAVFKSVSSSPEEESLDYDIDTIQTNGVTVDSLTDSCLIFISPYLEYINDSYSRVCGVVEHNNWSPWQKKCVAILLVLLDTVMVCSSDEVFISKLMESIMMCHCGAIKLIEWMAVERRQGIEDEKDLLSQEGLAHFTYLILVKDYQKNFLPQIIAPFYLLQICLPHVHLLLTQYIILQCTLTLNGLVLLDDLLKNIPHHSLPTSVLDLHHYSSLCQVLCKLMTHCPYINVRQKSQTLLLMYITCFNSRGRYHLYKCIFEEVEHPGIQGLIVHEIKEEVNTALSATEKGSPFIGEGVQALYRKFLWASSEMDVLSEFDRVMAGLNFIRYLLLRDKPSQNQTMIWSDATYLRNQFLSPLRSAVVSLQHYCRTRLNDPDQYRDIVSNEDGPEVNVSVIGGEKLPEMTPEQEIKTLKTSLFKLDIVLSVLARVEELMVN